MKKNTEKQDDIVTSFDYLINLRVTFFNPTTGSAICKYDKLFYIQFYYLFCASVIIARVFIDLLQRS